VQELNPKKVILVHGEKGSIGWTAEMIREMDPKIDVIVPEAGTEITL